MGVSDTYFGPSPLSYVNYSDTDGTTSVGRYLPIWVHGPNLVNVELFSISYGVGNMVGGTFLNNDIQVPANVLFGSPIRDHVLGWTTTYTIDTKYDITVANSTFMICRADHMPLVTFLPITNPTLADRAGRPLKGDVLVRVRLVPTGTMTQINVYINAGFRSNYSM